MSHCEFVADCSERHVDECGSDEDVVFSDDEAERAYRESKTDQPPPHNDRKRQHNNRSNRQQPQQNWTQQYQRPPNWQPAQRNWPPFNHPQQAPHHPIGHRPPFFPPHWQPGFAHWPQQWHQAMRQPPPPPPQAGSVYAGEAVHYSTNAKNDP